MQTKPAGLSDWVNFLREAQVPVLKRTVRELREARDQDHEVHVVTTILRHDPLMTLILLRYLQQNKRRSQVDEVVQVEQALMMIGLQGFYDKVVPGLLAEDVLKSQPAAIIGLLHSVQQATRSAYFARDWSIRLKDLHFDEIHVAALLHNFADILLWCHTPEQMIQVRTLQLQNSALRTRDAQRQVLGFKISDLQLELAKTWQLPELLIHFMERNWAHERQMRTLVLSVNLSRHLSNGWEDAAFPDDYQDISELLHLPPGQVMELVREAKT